MRAILEQAIEAHGGHKAWASLGFVAATAYIDGTLWKSKGKSHLLERLSFQLDTKSRYVESWSFRNQLKLIFSANTIRQATKAGRSIEYRSQMTSTFKNRSKHSLWDDMQASYFNSYVLWTYVTQPFSYIGKGVKIQELGKHNEDGQVWQKLSVVRLDYSDEHFSEQISYFGDNGLLLRSDYNVDIIGGTRIATYFGGFSQICDVIIPTQMRSFVIDQTNRPNMVEILYSVDLENVRPLRNCRAFSKFT